MEMIICSCNKFRVRKNLLISILTLNSLGALEECTVWYKMYSIGYTVPNTLPMDMLTGAWRRALNYCIPCLT